MNSIIVICILFRYRKFNLFLEDHEVRPPLTPDVITFDTDFGVKFGLLICFDLLFESPMKELLDQGVQNLAYPTMWYSHLPFLSGSHLSYYWNAHILRLYFKILQHLKFNKVQRMREI